MLVGYSSVFAESKVASEMTPLQQRISSFERAVEAGNFGALQKCRSDEEGCNIPVLGCECDSSDTCNEKAGKCVLGHCAGRCEKPGKPSPSSTSPCFVHRCINVIGPTPLVMIMHCMMCVIVWFWVVISLVILVCFILQITCWWYCCCRNRQPQIVVVNGMGQMIPVQNANTAAMQMQYVPPQHSAYNVAPVPQGRQQYHRLSNQ